jgi:hypothetical protein
VKKPFRQCMEILERNLRDRAEERVATDKTGSVSAPLLEVADAIHEALSETISDSELDKLAQILTDRHHALHNYPSDGGNPTTALSGALIAIKEVIEAIHAIKAEETKAA